MLDDFFDPFFVATELGDPNKIRRESERKLKRMASLMTRCNNQLENKPDADLVATITEQHGGLMRSKESYSAVGRKTKEIYISQHRNFSIDKTIFERHRRMAQDPKSYDLPGKFFEGKSVLDAGCGNSGYFQVAMWNLVVSKVTSLDLGTDWMPELEKVLRSNDVPEHLMELVEGSTTKLPFADDSFDFVASNGVIMHLEGIDQARAALRELTRVTKKGGYLYVYSGVESPGIMDRYIVPALRAAYSEDDDFRRLIDEINPRKISKELVRLMERAKKFDSTLSLDFISAIPDLFTLDSATFFQNMLQVPIQQGPKLGFGWVRSELEELGMQDIRRVKEAYWIRNDFRKYLAPLHYFRSEGLAKTLYGGGHVRVVAKKAPAS